MAPKKVLVYGYFGYQNNQLDGQTIKTRSIFELLKKKASEADLIVEYFDTQTFKADKRNFLKSWWSISKCDVLFYLPAHNSLKYLFPFIYLLCKAKKIDIHYVVVGGWLANFLRSLPLHKKLLAKVCGIYPQTNDLCVELRDEYGFQNTYQLPNFRFQPIDDEEGGIRLDNTKLNLVFMARVQPMKGTNVLFKLAEELIRQGYLNVNIDIYGPIQQQYLDEFEKRIRTLNNVKYKGVLQPDDINRTLKAYDLMLFPTRYFTEGFPGSILDAYMADLPVAVSKWKYADEFVLNHQSGIICEFDKPDDFTEKVIKLIDDRDMLKRLRNHVSLMKFKYSPDHAWEVLKSNMTKIPRYDS